jgi:hypothetical protein
MPGISRTAPEPGTPGMLLTGCRPHPGSGSGPPFVEAATAGAAFEESHHAGAHAQKPDSDLCSHLLGAANLNAAEA